MKMKKRKMIVSAAVAATAAATSVLALYPVSAQTNENNALTKAADILGIGQDELLVALKKAKIEMIEHNISNGLIDPKVGIEIIQKIEDTTDFHFLPK